MHLNLKHQSDCFAVLARQVYMFFVYLKVNVTSLTIPEYFRHSATLMTTFIINMYVLYVQYMHMCVFSEPLLFSEYIFQTMCWAPKPYVNRFKFLTRLD